MTSPRRSVEQSILFFKNEGQRSIRDNRTEAQIYCVLCNIRMRITDGNEERRTPLRRSQEELEDSNLERVKNEDVREKLQVKR